MITSGFALLEWKLNETDSSIEVMGSGQYWCRSERQAEAPELMAFKQRKLFCKKYELWHATSWTVRVHVLKGMYTWRCANYKTAAQFVLWSSQTKTWGRPAKRGLQWSMQESISETTKLLGGISSEVLSNGTDKMKFKESCFADEIDMILHGQLFPWLEIRTEVSDRTGEGNSSLIDGQTCWWVTRCLKKTWDSTSSVLLIF